MKTKDLLKLIPGLSLVGDMEEITFDAQDQFYWDADDEKTYIAIEQEISSILYNRKNWRIYAWYDVGGFEYWSKAGLNYIQLTLHVKKDTITKQEFEAIKKAWDQALSRAGEIGTDFIGAISRLRM